MVFPMGEEQSHLRDQPGPNHAPNSDFSSGIEGVILQGFPFVEYELENALTELYRPEWPGVFATA